MTGSTNILHSSRTIFSPTGYLAESLDNLMNMLASDPINPSPNPAIADLQKYVAEWRKNPFTSHIVAQFRNEWGECVPTYVRAPDSNGFFKITQNGGQAINLDQTQPWTIQLRTSAGKFQYTRTNRHLGLLFGR